VAPQLEFAQFNGVDNKILMTHFYELMVEERILMPTISHSFSHSEKDLKHTLEATDRVLQKISRLDLSDIPLKSSTLIEPVFRKFN
jgi:glutamate-1-semialdehyde aminotransferase